MVEAAKSGTDWNKVGKVTCPQGHKMFHYQNGYKRVAVEKSTEANEQTQDAAATQPTVTMDRTTSMHCSICEKSFERTATSGFASCKETCNYIVCGECSCCQRCPKMLTVWFKNGYGSNESSTWFSCNLCRSSHGYGSGKTQEERAYLRCEKCQTDICRKCVLVKHWV